MYNNQYAGNAQRKKSNMIAVTGLWRRRSKKGTEFYAGTIDFGKVEEAYKLGYSAVLIFEKREKQKQNDPDYILYLAEKSERKQSSSFGQGQPSSSSWNG